MAMFNRLMACFCVRKYLTFVLSVIILFGNGFFSSALANNNSFFSSKNTGAVKNGEACFTRAEAAAEQLLRLHSELLVLGLSCDRILDVNITNGMNFSSENDTQSISDLKLDGDSYQRYLEFSKRHKDLLALAEKTLVDYYKRTGHTSPDSVVNDMRTSMVNDISHIAVSMRPDVFCYQFGGRLLRANFMSETQLIGWSHRYFIASPPSRFYCENQR